MPADVRYYNFVGLFRDNDNYVVFRKKLKEIIQLFYSG
jgi:hypothetical protein